MTDSEESVGWWGNQRRLPVVSVGLVKRYCQEEDHDPVP